MSVLDQDGNVKEKYNTKNIMIATGSEVTPFPGIEASRMFLYRVVQQVSDMGWVDLDLGSSPGW